MNIDDVVYYRMPSMRACGYIDTPGKITKIIDDKTVNIMMDDGSMNLLEAYTLPVYGAEEIISDDPEVIARGWYRCDPDCRQWVYGCVTRM